MQRTRIEVAKGLGGYGTLGLEIVLSVLIGLFGGRWADAKLGTAPGFLIFGLLVGGGAAIKAVLRARDDLARVAAREEREQGNPEPLYESDPDRVLRQAELLERRLRLERAAAEPIDEAERLKSVEPPVGAAAPDEEPPAEAEPR